MADLSRCRGFVGESEASGGVWEWSVNKGRRPSILRRIKPKWGDRGRVRRGRGTTVVGDRQSCSNSQEDRRDRQEYTHASIQVTDGNNCGRPGGHTDNHVEQPGRQARQAGMQECTHALARMHTGTARRDPP